MAYAIRQKRKVVIVVQVEIDQIKRLIGSIR